jgi:hypothetical protein
MNSLKQMAAVTGIAVLLVVLAAFLWSGTLKDTSFHIAQIPDEPGMLVVALGSSYDEPSKKDLQTVFRIPVGDCDKQPTWNPAAEELPIPLSELQKIAFKKSLGSDEKAWATWKVTNVEFKRFGWAGLDQEKARENRWSCELTLTNQDPDHYDYKTVCMLLDGTCVPPKPR